MYLEDYFVNEKGSNHQLLKQNNHNLIKKFIYRNSPISRVEIAHQLGLLDKLRLKPKVGRELAGHQDMHILLSWFCHLLLCDLGQVSWLL